MLKTEFPFFLQVLNKPGKVRGAVQPFHIARKKLYFLLAFRFEALRERRRRFRVRVDAVRVRIAEQQVAAVGNPDRVGGSTQR